MDTLKIRNIGIVRIQLRYSVTFPTFQNTIFIRVIFLHQTTELLIRKVRSIQGDTLFRERRYRLRNNRHNEAYRKYTDNNFS